MAVALTVIIPILEKNAKLIFKAKSCQKQFFVYRPGIKCQITGGAREAILGFQRKTSGRATLEIFF